MKTRLVVLSMLLPAITAAQGMRRIQLAPLADAAEVRELVPLLRLGELGLVRSYGNGALKQVSLVGLVDAAPGAVWDVLTAFERHAAIVPSLVGSDVLKREADRVVVAYEREVLGGNVEFTLLHRLRPPGRIDSTVHGGGGDVEMGAWRWELIPYAGGRQTIVVRSQYARLAEATSWANLRAAGGEGEGEYTLNLADGLEMIQAIKREVSRKSAAPGQSPADDE